MANVDMTRIAGNIAAMNSLYSLNNINNKLAVHQERLSTGKRINNAGDDPAGLTIATKLNSRSESMKVALSNIADAKNLVSVAESGVSKINDILTKMKGLAMQGASDTMGTDERSALTTQMENYASLISEFGDQTKWNNTVLFGTGAASTAFTFQTGPDDTDTTTMAALSGIDRTSMSMAAADITALTDAATFNGFLSTLEDNMTTISGKLSDIGGLTNKLSFKEEQLSVSQINVDAAYNRIMNANMAEEQVNASKYQILQQTATAMLSQANAAPQFLLSLFK